MRHVRELTVLTAAVLFISSLISIVQADHQQIESKSSSFSMGSSLYEVQTRTSFNENFSNPVEFDWSISKGHPLSTVAITNGELELESYGITAQTAWHPTNQSTQDYKIAFNYRYSDDPGSPPIGGQYSVLWTGGVKYPIYETQIYERVGINVCQWQNGSLFIEHDDGTLWYTPTVAYFWTPVLAPNLNYQITVQAWGWNDSAALTVYNKSAGANLGYYPDLPTLCTHADRYTPSGIVDRIGIGDMQGYGGSRYFHAFWDNFTMTYTGSDHSGTTLNEYGVQQTLNAFGATLSSIEYTPDHYRLAYDSQDPTWLINPAYYLVADDYTNSRDDVAGELIENLVILYENTGNESYLDTAETVWSLLVTHQHADGGWTFGTDNADYVDNDARIVFGLLALYRVTGNESYLITVQETIASMYPYQNATGHVMGRHDRGLSLYRFEEQVWSAAFFVVALLEAYQYIPDLNYLSKATESLGWIISHQTPSGRLVSPPFAGLSPSPDWNDVVNTGCALWALSVGYKYLDTAEYLHHAELAANYIVGSEFVKNSESTGMWAGMIFDRYNQSNLLYNWPILAGLSTYLKVTDDNDAAETFYAALNRMVSIMGTNVSVQGDELYGMDGQWAGAWNMNQSDSQGWTCGYWREGPGGVEGWGTWGTWVWYGWQAAMIKVLADALAAPSDDHIYTRSGVIATSTGTINALFMGSTEETGLTVTSDERTFVLVKTWNAGDIMARVNFSSTSGTVDFKFHGIGNNSIYSLKVDGEVERQVISANDTGVLSYTYSGDWSQHEILLEVSIYQNMMNILYPIIIIGIIFVVITGVVGIVIGATSSKKH